MHTCTHVFIRTRMRARDRVFPPCINKSHPLKLAYVASYRNQQTVYFVNTHISCDKFLVLVSAFLVLSLLLNTMQAACNRYNSSVCNICEYAQWLSLMIHARLHAYFCSVCCRASGQVFDMQFIEVIKLSMSPSRWELQPAVMQEGKVSVCTSVYGEQ